MSRTIAERLLETADRAFIGRDREVAVLRQAMMAEESPFLVAFVHGPGGVGKSRLVRNAIEGTGASRRCIWLDCAGVEPTPRGFLAALGEGVGHPTPDPESAAREMGGSVLVLDTYEAFGLLDSWLRRDFLPTMPGSLVTVMAGREPPNPAWFTTPGWQSLFRAMELQGLPHGEAVALLASRGIDRERAELIDRFARGHPLALELAAAALSAQPDLRIDSGPPAQVVQELTRAFLDGLAPELAEAVRGASVMRRVTEPALEALVRPAAGRALFADLAALPFVEVTGEGLALHDVVRDTVAGDLAARDPGLHRRLQRRAWRFLTVDSRATLGLGLWRQTADLLFLVQNPAVRLAFFPAGAAEFSVGPAAAGDGMGIIAIAADVEPAKGAEMIGRWWKALPNAFHVARDRAGEIAAFYILAEPGDVADDLAREDPVVAGWLDHLRHDPVAGDERVLFLRRWLGRRTGEAVTPQIAACFLDVKGAYMELRPYLQRLYTTVRDPSGYPYGSALSMLPLPGAPVEIDGAAYHSLLLEFGEASVDGWLARMIGVELGAGEPMEEVTLPDGTVTIMFTDIVDSTALTERLGDRGFRELAGPLDEGLRRAIGATGGVVVEGRLLGDGIMAVFTSARQAIECGRRSADVARESGLRLRVGLHSGDVISEGGNIFGGAVNAAARVAALASPGELLVSGTVRALARTSADVGFEDRGEHLLKGIAEAQRVYAVVPGREAPPRPGT